MKIKKSKKILSLFLSAVMVLTTFAAMPFSSFAAEYSAADLKSLLDSYELKLDETLAYTNLADSYDAYVAAYRVYIGVLSGLTDADEIDEAYANLEAEMAEMSVWEPYTADAMPSYNVDTTGTTYDGYVDSETGFDYAVNLIYSPTCTTYGVANEYQSVTIDMYYPDTVMLYDGVNTPTMPVMAMATKSTTNSRYIYQLYPCVSTSDSSDNAYFRLTGNWHGYSISDDLDHNWPLTMQNANYYPQGAAGTANTSERMELFVRSVWGVIWDKYMASLANGMQFVGEMDSSTYSASYNLTWYRVTGNDPDDITSFENTGATIYVINYKALLDAVQISFDNIYSYRYDQVSSLFAALEAAMAIDPNSYDYASGVASAVSSCASDIESAVSNINTYVNRLTLSAGTYSIDMESYITLAQSLSAYAAVYNRGNDDGTYSSRLWTVFTAAYESALAELEDVVSGTENFTDASTLYNNLVTAYNTIASSSTSKIDDTALQALFVTYYALTEGYYTEETYSEATAAVEHALEYYEDGSYILGITLTQSDENQAIYDGLLAEVSAAIAALRLSRDARIGTSYGSYSYNTVMEAYNELDGSEYSNFSSATDAANALQVVMEELESTDFTSQSDLISTYTSAVQALINAINALVRIVVIEDGSVVSVTYGSTSGYTEHNLATYLDNQITEITYLKTVSGTSSYTTEYDLTFDNTFYNWGSNHSAELHGLGFGAYAQDTITQGNDSMSVLWKEGGAAFVDSSNGVYTYHTALMKYSTTISPGNDYILLPSNTTGITVLGETTVTVADEGIRAVTITTPDIYELFYVSGANSGNETKAWANSDLKQTVTVLDISAMFALIDEATALRDASLNNWYNCYTADSYAAFIEALEAVSTGIDFTGMTNDEILADAQDRYDTLEAAIEALVINEDGTHSYEKQSDSIDATCTENGTIYYQCASCGNEVSETEAALGHDFVYTGHGDYLSHTTTCTRGDYQVTGNCVNDDDDIYCDFCGQPLVVSADFTDFDAAKAELEALLAASLAGTVKFTAAALGQADSDIAAIAFYNYTDDQKLKVDDQDAVDTQTAMIIAAKEALANGVADDSVYEAYQTMLATMNADAYDIVTIKSTVEDIEITTTVTVNGTEYTGYNYDPYNFAFGEALTEYHIPYTVTVYDADGNKYYALRNADGSFGGYTTDEDDAGVFYYGETLTVTNPAAEGEECSWYSYTYTTRLEPDVSDKYQYTAAAFTFTVRGYTELTADMAVDSEDAVQIVFKLALDGVETDKILEVVYAEAGDSINIRNLTIYDSIYNLPFCQIVNFTDVDGNQLCAYSRSARITATESMTVLVQVETVNSDAYLIELVDEEGTELFSYYYSYNDLVELDASTDVDGVVAYVNAENGNPLCYGETYSFYACRSITIKAVTSIEQTACVDLVEPILSTNAAETSKVYLVASFVLPEGCTAVSFGFVLDRLDSNHSDVTLADLDTSLQIFNLSASKYTNEGQNGNQFTVSFNQSEYYLTGTVRAYVIYTDANGAEHYVYSDAITNASLYDFG